jgi:hypothetical protein
MEEEAREILSVALAGKPVTESNLGESNLGESVRRRFVALGGVELAHLPREPMREPPSL